MKSNFIVVPVVNNPGGQIAIRTELIDSVISIPEVEPDPIRIEVDEYEVDDDEYLAPGVRLIVRTADGENEEAIHTTLSFDEVMQLLTADGLQCISSPTGVLEEGQAELLPGQKLSRSMKKIKSHERYT